jgi:photosynthetic reaction center cytochrome c subunit
MKSDLTLPKYLALGYLAVIIVVLSTVSVFLGLGWTVERVHATQNGYRGTGMDQINWPAAERALKAANVVPEALDPASPEGDKATDVYQNVQVLKDLSAEQFGRVMSSITEWVAPDEGCGYCHNVENMADDSLYTKKVARRMLEMTRHINNDWKAHVANTGVTCYTCHKGNPVPANIWFADPGPQKNAGVMATNDGMGHPNKTNGSTSLHLDPLSPLLLGKEPIRVAGTTGLPAKPYGASIQATERTYSLMMHMSTSLGVNCTFCHNSRSFSDWADSTPQRMTAWHGIQMARELNAEYLEPLRGDYPPNRLGPLGDAPKVSCATCHQGANKPLLGVSMAKDYPELGGVPAK